MKIDKVNPQLQSYAKKVPAIPFHRLWCLKLTRILFKLGLAKSECVDGVSYSDITLLHAKVRIYKPQHAQSGIGVLWIHGGGLITGSPAQDNRTCSRYAKELGAVVCAVTYRLAPENPYPAGLDDCLEVWMWMQKQAKQLGIDPNRILLAGQSGGACLATSLAQRLVDNGGQQPAAQLLYCPMLDDRTADASELDSLNHILWNNRSNRAAWSWYLNGGDNNLPVPKGAVPARRNDLSGMPPTWIGIGDIDLFYQESVEYAKRLEDAGVVVEFDHVEKAPHNFENFAHGSDFVEQFFSRHFNSVRKLLAINLALK